MALLNCPNDVLFTAFLGKPVMIVTEYMENGSLDSFLRVSEMHMRMHAYL